jgi:hypothetical protein
LAEPYLFLPSLLILSWLFVLLRPWLKVGTGKLLVVATLLMAGMLALSCLVWVWWQGKDEEEPSILTSPLTTPIRDGGTTGGSDSPAVQQKADRATGNRRPKEILK